MKRRLLLPLIFLSLLIPLNLRADTCAADSSELQTKAHQLEIELIQIERADKPATDVRALSRDADTLESQLLVCEISAYAAKNEEMKSQLEETRKILEFIEQAQLLNGGRASVSNPGWPADLVDLAPSCSSVLSLNLIERIENGLRFSSPDMHQVPFTSSEVMRYYDHSNELLRCALQAQEVGYKDASIRMLTALSTVENGMILTDSEKLK